MSAPWGATLCCSTVRLRRTAVSGHAGWFVPATLELERNALEMSMHRLARRARIARGERRDDRFVVRERLRPERHGVEMNFYSRPEVAAPQIPEA